MGIVISDSPQSVNDAHAHGANARQQTANYADNKRKAHAQCQKRLGKHKGWQQPSQSQPDNRDQQVGKSQTEKAADEGNDDGLRQDEEKNSAPGEANGFANGKL